MAEEYSKDWLKKKSLALNLGFADCFRGLMLEEMLYDIFSETKPLLFVLENEAIIGEDAYRSGDESQIHLWFQGKEELIRDEIVNRLSGNEKIRWEVGELQQRENGWFLPVSAYVLDMCAPFSLCLKKADDEVFYKEENYLGLAHKKMLHFYVCAPEQQLGKWIYLIWNRLELISTMEEYDKAYQVLNRYSVNGRRFTEEIKKAWGDATFTGNRIETLKTYRSYRYMEKRWISYCKNKSMRTGTKYEISWEMIVDCICSFSNPIWESLQADSVFIGDWMPELGRFM